MKFIRFDHRSRDFDSKRLPNANFFAHVTKLPLILVFHFLIPDT